MEIEDKTLVAFGQAVRAHRKGKRMSLRVLADQTGLSASYLSSIECGRNPSTGRPPQPSVGVAERLRQVLGMADVAFLSEDGSDHVCHGECDHILLYRLDKSRDGLEAYSSQLVDGRISNWICIADPNTQAISTEEFHSWTWAFRSDPYPDEFLDASRIVVALEAKAGTLPAEIGADDYGLIIADCSAVMRWMVNPDAEVEFENQWCAQSGAALDRVLGREPLVNMCVYHQLDMEAISGRVDLLNTLLRLFESHGRIAAILPDGRLVDGVQAINAILHENRPVGISGAAWRTVSAALAASLADRREANPSAGYHIGTAATG